MTHISDTSNCVVLTLKCVDYITNTPDTVHVHSLKQACAHLRTFCLRNCIDSNVQLVFTNKLIVVYVHESYRRIKQNKLDGNIHGGSNVHTYTRLCECVKISYMYTGK